MKIQAHIMNESLHINLVRLSIVSGRRVTLSLVPQHRLNLAVARRRFRPPHHTLVQVPPTRPLLDRRPADGARNQPDHPHALLDGVGERHPGAHAARLLGVDVGVERLERRLPVEVGVEAEDGGGVGEALGGHVSVPVVVPDAAAAGHVALAGEYEDVLFGLGVFLGGVSGFHGRL